MEKLIEEIRKHFIHNWGRSSHDCVEEAITRIGKAYADGELELPGEVGRGDLVWGNLGIGPCWDGPPTEPLNRQEPYHRFIALREEEEK